MKHTFTALTLLFLSTVTVAAAMGQDGAMVKLTSEVLREVVTVDGSGTKITQLVPATSAMPGEVLTLKINYINEGDEEATDIILTNPIPEHMVYQGGSAEREGANTTYSVDGGGTYGLPEFLTVTGDDGQKRKAIPYDYTHIRWQLVEPVPARGGGTVTFRARVK
ncbi:MAG: hypothetical protein RRA15_00295 [bacterium]|nr:hypothetical protein [bacterium]MDT8364914.1 hypothetical protein [bacterium]